MRRDGRTPPVSQTLLHAALVVRRDYETMRRNGIRFVREREQADYGTVAVFEDLYGNLWDLIERAPSERSG